MFVVAIEASIEARAIGMEESEGSFSRTYPPPVSIRLKMKREAGGRWKKCTSSCQEGKLALVYILWLAVAKRIDIICKVITTTLVRASVYNLTHEMTITASTALSTTRTGASAS
jgi:hypothetical protein